MTHGKRRFPAPCIAGRIDFANGALKAAAGLADRGIIASGRRADLILVDTRDERPRVVATIVAGRIVHLVDADRIMAS